MEIWRATAGSERRVKAADRLFDHSVDLKSTRRFLENNANYLLIAYVDDQPAGFVSGTELTHPDQSRPELFLNELGVDEAHRGRGIGRELVAKLWELAQSHGCRGMWVLTDESNVPAQKVYAGAGARRGEAQLMFEWGES
jgi:ribosomal protein S18 acetylase RimI-like enzyme